MHNNKEEGMKGKECLEREISMFGVKEYVQSDNERWKEETDIFE